MTTPRTASVFTGFPSEVTSVAVRCTCGTTCSTVTSESSSLSVASPPTTSSSTAGCSVSPRVHRGGQAVRGRASNLPADDHAIAYATVPLAVHEPHAGKAKGDDGLQLGAPLGNRRKRRAGRKVSCSRRRQCQPEMFQQRKPLRPTARRASWVGYVLRLDLPEAQKPVRLA